jgi:hypothetical protein
MPTPTITPPERAVEQVEPLVKSTRPPHPLVVAADAFLAACDHIITENTITTEPGD